MTSAHNDVVHLFVSLRKLIAETCVLLLWAQIKLHSLYTEKLRDISTVKNPTVLRHVVSLVCSRAATLRELRVHRLLQVARTLLQSNSLTLVCCTSCGDKS